MYHVYVCTAAYQVPGTGTYFLDLFPGAEGANNHFNLYIYIYMYGQQAHAGVCMYDQQAHAGACTTSKLTLV